MEVKCVFSVNPSLLLLSFIIIIFYILQSSLVRNAVRANDASNSNRPSRLLMDFNSSYYSIMVFSQQLFVYKIFSLQDLYVQSQETSLNSFIIIWFNLHVNAVLFALGVIVYV